MGLKPQISDKIGQQKSCRESWAFAELIGAFSGPESGPMHGGSAEIAPKRALLAEKGPFGPVGAFGPSPHLLSPRLDLLDKVPREHFLANGLL